MNHPVSPWPSHARAASVRLLAHSAVVAALVLLLVLSPAAPAARAATQCLSQGAVNAIFDGAMQQTTTYGVYTNLDTQVGALCTTGNSQSLSTAWAMLTGGSNIDGWAQSGILTSRSVGNGLQMYYFSSWAEQNPAVVTGAKVYTNTPGVITGSHNYQEQYNFDSGVIQMWMDTTVLDQTNFDPITVWSAPWYNEWLGETHDPGDDMPGTSSSPEHFRYLQYKACRSCGYQSPSGLQLSCVCSRYSYAWDTQNYNFRIWTSG